MAAPPCLTVSNGDGSNPSPARGAEMRDFLQSRLQKNRAPPLVHSWDFWHDRQDRSGAHIDNNQPSQPAADASTNNYEDRLVRLAEVSDVRHFWTVFNNFDVSTLPLRDSVHLFHKGIKPVWEDPRNTRGGSWTFRVPKMQGSEFWKEICMLAIGEQLQQAIETDRTTFRDDICGVSLGVRYNSMLIQVWNRDGTHTTGIDNLLSTVLSSLPDELGMREGSYYYKRHNEHAAFAASAPTQTASDATVLSIEEQPDAYLSEPAKGVASVTRSSPPLQISQAGEALTKEAKDQDPVEDMRATLTDMKGAMDSVAGRNPEDFD
jgi:hypothetical protein